MTAFELSLGLSHSFKHLGEMKRNIAFLDREAQATYSTTLCRDRVSSASVFDDNIIGLCFDRPEYGMWNATLVGNLAYIVLHKSMTEEQRCRAEEMLSGYAAWVRAL